MQTSPKDNSIYAPAPYLVADVREESADTRTLVLEPRDGPLFQWQPGQFAMYGVYGEGECPLTIASSPTRGRLECTLRRAGRVTRALFDCEPGDEVGVRGPYGKGFPLGDWRGKPIVFAAGGIGLPALRSSIEYVLDKRGDYGDVAIVYGAKSTREIIYRAETAEWARARDCRLVTTVDPGGEDAGWKGDVGLVPQVLEKTGAKPEGAVALVCGPPIMIKFSIAALRRMGFAPGVIYTTLENRMKCGVGKCGRCNVGSVYVCKDGPVFTAAEIERMPDDL